MIITGAFRNPAKWVVGTFQSGRMWYQQLIRFLDKKKKEKNNVQCLRSMEYPGQDLSLFGTVLESLVIKLFVRECF